MTDVAETTLSRITHDEVLHKFWLGRIFSPAPRKPSGPTRYAVPSAETLDRILSECKGDKESAAKVFGVFSSTLRKWMRERGVANKWAIRLHRKRKGEV